MECFRLLLALVVLLIPCGNLLIHSRNNLRLSLGVLVSVAAGNSIPISDEIEPQCEGVGSEDTDSNVCKTAEELESDLESAKKRKKESASKRIKKRVRTKQSQTDITKQNGYTDYENLLVKALETLVGSALPSSHCIIHETNRWWNYKWCHKQEVWQYHEVKGKEYQRWSIGKFKGGGRLTRASPRNNPNETLKFDSLSYYFDDGQHCDETAKGRQTEVRLQCCSQNSLKFHSQDDKTPPTIQSVVEVETCTYLMTVCLNELCFLPELNKKMRSLIAKYTEDQSIDMNTKLQNIFLQSSRKKLLALINEKENTRKQEPSPLLSDTEVKETRDRVKMMFYRAYDAYMKNAFPLDELKPLTCTGENFELTAGNMLTLIDSLDMLVVLGNYSEFARAVKLVGEHANFHQNKTVNVFETTIRILGGLLSAHVFASDPEIVSDYDGKLLELSVDLADRLLPAFNSTTSIPYGTIHLLNGVPKGETTEACTAAAGSLSLEFGMLSVLTGEKKYGVAARDALKAIFDLRSRLGLVGRHIDIESGRWTEPVAGIGSNIDSLYEYYLKHYILFGDDAAWEMFTQFYESVLKYLRIDNTWYVEADMHRGRVNRKQFNNLQAFWPGMQSLIGDVAAASKTINAFYGVWNDFGFTPEDFNFEAWEPLSGGSRRSYPLRPELAESTFFMHEATNDSSWLVAGRDMVNSLEATCRVGKCGYASVKDIKRKLLDDTMPSFFMSETCKYLYLLFDLDHPMRNKNGGQYVFTTEAHMFEISNDIMKKAREMQFSFSVTRRREKESTRSGKAEDSHLWGITSLLEELRIQQQCAANELYPWNSTELPESYYKTDEELFSNPPFKMKSKTKKKKKLPKKKNEEGSSLKSVSIKGANGNRFTVLPYEAGFGVVESATRNSVEISGLGFSQASVIVETELGFIGDNVLKLKDEIDYCIDEDEGFHTPSDDLSEKLRIWEDVKKKSFFDDAVEDDKVTEKDEVEIEAEEAIWTGTSVETRYFFFENQQSTYATECSLHVYESDPAYNVCLNRMLFEQPIVLSWEDLIPPLVIPCSFALYGPKLKDMSSVAGSKVMKLKSMQQEHDYLSYHRGCSKSAYREEEHHVDADGKIVMVDRGSCMFEDKTVHAQDAGAAAVIIVQTKNEPLFLMNGKSNQQNIKDLLFNMLKVEKKDEKQEEVCKIPSYMIRFSDSEILKHLSKKSDKVAVTASVRHPTSKEDLKQFRGKSKHPVWAGRYSNRMVVMNGAGWGAHLSTENNRWQLSVVDDR